MVARICLSDLHLGDARSVLGDPAVAESVAKEIGRITGGHIGQLVLNGDIWEECTPEKMDERDDARDPDAFAKSVVNASMDFFASLFLHNKVDEIVWVPGNHDLSLWFSMFNGSRPYTGTRGLFVSSLDTMNLIGRAEARIAYPVFMPSSSPWILFSHGHLMDPMVRGIAPDYEYAALAALGCGRPLTANEGEASLQKLAERTDPFSRALWKRYSQFDASYQKYILRRFDHLPDDPEAARGSGSYVPAHSVIDTAKGSLFSHVDWLLTAALLDPKIPTPVSKDEPMTFVFGHDHLGTRAYRQVCDQQALVVDSGGWTSDYPGHRPHSRVLVWASKEDADPTVYYISTPGLS